MAERTPEDEGARALTALYLQVPGEVGDDVQRKVRAWVAFDVKREQDRFVKILERMRPYNNIYGEGMNKKIDAAIEKVRDGQG